MSAQSWSTVKQFGIHINLKQLQRLSQLNTGQHDTQSTGITRQVLCMLWLRKFNCQTSADRCTIYQNPYVL